MKVRVWGFLGAASICALSAAVHAQTVSGVFFDEGWESGSSSATFNSSYYGSASGPQFLVQNLVRAAGAYALEHRLAAGTAGSSIQYATQHFGDSIAGPVHANGRGQHFTDLYIQYKAYYSSNFDIANVPKQLIIGTQDDRSHGNVCCNPWVAHYITVYAPFGNRDWNAEANNKQAASGQWVGFGQNASGYGPNNVFAIQLGRWYTYEVRRRLNDSGVDNGIFQMWVDGVLISDHRNVRYRTPWNGTYGSNFTYGTNFMMISDYMGNGASRNESIFFDDVKLSTSYIGARDTSTTPPAPPTNLRIIR